MTAPTPVQPDPRPTSRPEPAGGASHWAALTPEAIATGGHDWQELRDGYKRPLIRKAELLPVDVNGDAEQAAPPVGGTDGV
jgi:hypothetical protein